MGSESEMLADLSEMMAVACRVLPALRADTASFRGIARLLFPSNRTLSVSCEDDLDREK
jgi:hypothetical protein